MKENSQEHKHKTFEDVYKERLSQACTDTHFIIFGDRGFSLNAYHDFVKDTWVVEVSIKDKVISLIDYKTDTLLNYLTIIESDYIPSLGVIYDDLNYVIKTSSSAVFDASSRVLNRIIPESIEKLQEIVEDSLQK